MLTGLLAAALTLQTRSSTFLKTPGGASVSVESEPGKTFALCLAFRVPSGMAPWHAHLAEHLLIAGKDGTLPARLQTYDIRIQGVTTRSQACVIMDGPAAEAPAAILALQEILGTPEPADVSRETGILNEEGALRPPSDEVANQVYGSIGVGTLYPGENEVPPSGWLNALKTQSGVAVACVLDGQDKPTAEALAKALAQLPEAAVKPGEAKLNPTISTPKAVAIKVGPAGTPSFVAGAAFAVALSGRTGGEAIIDLDCKSAYAIISGDKPTPRNLEDALAAAPSVARILADHWTADPPTWVQFKAASLLAGLRVRRSDVVGLARDLRPAEYAAAADSLRS